MTLWPVEQMYPEVREKSVTSRSRKMWETKVLKTNNSKKWVFTKSADAFLKSYFHPPKTEEEKQRFWVCGGKMSHL